MTGAGPAARPTRAAWRVLAVLLALQAPGAGAQELVEPPARRGELIDLPLVLILNGQPRGDVFAKASEGGDILVQPSTLSDLGVDVRGGTLHYVEGVGWLSLRSIAGARFEFDERNLVLTLTLPPDWFGEQAKDLSLERNRRSVRTEDTSALLNYRLGQRSVDGAGETTTLATEVAVRHGASLLRGDSLWLDGETGSQFVRFQTQLLHDDRDTAQRWLIGDTFAGTGELGSTLNLGGVSFSKAYQMLPYFVRYPTATFSGVAALPSEVEVYVGGTRVFRDRVDPGTFELRDFSYYGGRQDVRVVVRDALGVEQAYAYPYYFTNQSLGSGLHEYSYSAGWLREDYGLPGSDYGHLGASGVHRYGLNDFVTVGARAEYAEDRGNMGPLTILRSNHLGTLSLGTAISHAGGGESGGAASAAYAYQYETLTARAGYRELSSGYAVADPLAGQQLLRKEVLVGSGYGTPRLGNFDVQLAESLFRDRPEMRSAQFNYSRTLLWRATLFAQLRRVFSTPTSTDVFAGVSVTLGPLQNLSAFHTRTATGDTDVLQAGRSVGYREGFGYRLSAERTRQGTFEATRYSPYGEYNGRYATLIAENRTEQVEGGERTESWETAVQGSLDAVSGTLGFSRRIPDSFVLARITPPLEGVRVYHNSQEVGRTNAHGELLIPGVSSFLDNPVAIEDKDVPIEYGLGNVAQLISPPYRSGSLVAFRAQRTIGIAGRLLARRGAEATPVEYHHASLQLEDESVSFPTGAGGEFYLENVAPGMHGGSVVVEGAACEYEVAIPDRVAPLIELEDPVICEFR